MKKKFRWKDAARLAMSLLLTAALSFGTCLSVFAESDTLPGRLSSAMEAEDSAVDEPTAENDAVDEPTAENDAVGAPKTEDGAAGTQEKSADSAGESNVRRNSVPARLDGGADAPEDSGESGSAAVQAELPAPLAAPEGLSNIALGASVTATDSMPGGGLYDPSYLTDGKYGNYPAEQQLGWNVTAPASATVALNGTYRISRIDLHPVAFETGKFFPTAYAVYVSMDGAAWQKVGEASDVGDVGVTPQEVSFEAVEAAFVKLEVTPRDVVEANGSTSTYAQVSELAVYGEKVVEPDVPEQPVNVARGAMVTATDSMSGGGLYDPSYLTDGKYGNYPAEQQLGWNVSAAESAIIDLGGTASISRIVLYPITFEAGKFFPAAYTVFVSADGEEWKKVGEASDVPNVGTEPQEITFETVDAAFVKLDVTPRDVVEANGSTSTYAQVSEVEVYGVKKDVPAPPPISDTTLGLHDYALEGYVNLALNREGVTASDDNAHFGKAAKHVVDGVLEDTNLFGWDTYGSFGLAWLQIDLDGICEIERVVVYPFWTADAVGEYFPQEYQLQVSTDGENFTTVDLWANPNPRSAVTGAVIHDFPEVKARYVRINVTKANPKLMTEYGNDARPHSQIGEVNVYGFARDLAQRDPFAPEGGVYTNLALGKEASSADDDTTGGKAAAHVTDGLLPKQAPYGWSTARTLQAPAGPVDLTIDLQQSAALTRFVVYPFYEADKAGVCFPRAYELQVSSDGASYTTVAAKANNENVTRPQTIVLDDLVRARYVRLHVTESGREEGAALPYCTQVGEVCAYGIYESKAASINKTALRMTPGDVDYLTITYHGIGTPQVSYTAADPSVAKVTPEGKVTAVALGETTVTVSDATSGARYEVSVLVDDYVATENFMITAFWPIQNYNINDDYLDKMQECGITNIQLNFVLNTANYADNMTIAQMAYERGMGVTVSEKAWGWGAIADFTDEQIYQEALKYSHVPGVIGYYVIDEPASAAPFAHCFAPIKQAMPTADVHLNFVPNQANYLSLLEAVGQDLDYLMWDSYIYPNQGCNEINLFRTSDEARRLALKYGVKTAQFIQSCGFNSAFRKPNGNEIRYNVSAALAYGNKQIAYFTYRIPEDVGETFTSAIVNADGTKTEIFDDVAEINNAVLQLGPTLMRVEALEVYHTGRESGANHPLPEDFFLQPEEGTDLIVSYMRDNDTTQNYVMLVNRDYQNSAEAAFTMADEIRSLQYISDKNGQAKALAGEGQNYSVTLAPGGCILLKMPEGFDWTPDYGKFIEAPAGVNAANREGTSVRASSGNASLLVDGARIGNTYTDACGLPGYKAEVGDGLAITVDFGGAQTIDRIDLYPYSADTFPTSFVLESSADGDEWTALVTQTDYELPENRAAVLRFDAVQQRYLRLRVLETPSGQLRLHELEAYHDNGAMPELAPLDNAVPVDRTLQPADNLARAEDVTVLSSDDHNSPPYWQKKLINDGVGYDAIDRGNAGWSSNIGRVTADESAWVGYDLGKKWTLDKVVVFNAWHDRGAKKAECFPADYRIEISQNGETWVPVVTVYNDTNWEEVGARVFEFEPAAARYVRFHGTRLGRCGEGFMLQLSELEVYGTEYTEPDPPVDPDDPSSGSSSGSGSTPDSGSTSGSGSSGSTPAAPSVSQQPPASSAAGTSSPQTEDPTPLIPLALAAVLCAGMLVFLYGKRGRHREK